MRKLACLLVLVFSVPAFAVVFTLSDQGSGVVRINYDLDQAAGEGIRGLALTVNVTAGDAAVAHSAACYAGVFNTFIDFAADVDNAYTAVGQGHPFAMIIPDVVNGQYELHAFPANSFALSMGYLDQAGNQAAVTTDGYIDVTFTLMGYADVAVALDDLRGGVVGDNLDLSATGLPASQGIGHTHQPTKPTLIKTTAAPAVANGVNSGRVETFVASSTSQFGWPLEYQFNWGDGVVGPWGSATQTHVYTYTAAGVYSVTVQARHVPDPYSPSEMSLPYVVTREAVKSTAPFYAAWVSFGRPNCWGYQRSCRGDADGLGSGFGTSKVWVNSSDLGILACAFNVGACELVGRTYNGVPCICADNDRAATGFGCNKIWVNNVDLIRFAGYFNKMVSATPPCDAAWMANYHFWTN